MGLQYAKKSVCAARDILFCVGMLYLAEILGMMAGALVYEILPRAAMAPYLYSVIRTLAYILLLYGGMKLYEKKVLRMGSQKTERTSVHGVRVTLVFVLMELIYMVVTMVLVVFLCPGRWETAPENQQALPLFRTVLDFGIGAGVAEEIVFRGTLRKALQKQFGFRGAVGISSLIFGLLHVTNVTVPRQFLMTFFFTALLGLILCVVQYRAGTILAAMMFHALWNIVFFGVFNTGSVKSGSATATYVTSSPLADGIPLVTSALMLLFFAKMPGKKRSL